MAQVVTTIETYRDEVLNRIGRQYSLYGDRVVTILPEVIRQVLTDNQFLANELLKDDENNGTIIHEKAISIPAQKESQVYIDGINSNILQVLNVILSVRSDDCIISAIEPWQHAYAQYYSFDPSISLITYYMQANHMIIQNPAETPTTHNATVTLRKTQFISTMLTDLTTDLGKYFSYNLLLQFVSKGAELIRTEIGA